MCWSNPAPCDCSLGLYWSISCASTCCFKKKEAICDEASSLLKSHLLDSECQLEFKIPGCIRHLYKTSRSKIVKWVCCSVICDSPRFFWEPMPLEASCKTLLSISFCCTEWGGGSTIRQQTTSVCLCALASLCVETILRSCLHGSSQLLLMQLVYSRSPLLSKALNGAIGSGLRQRSTPFLQDSPTLKQSVNVQLPLSSLKEGYLRRKVGKRCFRLGWDGWYRAGKSGGHSGSLKQKADNSLRRMRT